MVRVLYLGLGSSPNKLIFKYVNQERIVDMKKNEKSFIRNIEWDNKNNKVTITFGKNGFGLTTEFAEINKIVEELSRNHYVYIENTIIDGIDDVYDITLKYLPHNEQNNSYTK